MSSGRDGVLRLTSSGFWGRSRILLLATRPAGICGEACGCRDPPSGASLGRFGRQARPHPPPGLQAQGLTSSVGSDLTSLQQALGISTQNLHNEWCGVGGCGGMWVPSVPSGSGVWEFPGLSSGIGCKTPICPAGDLPLPASRGRSRSQQGCRLAEASGVRFLYATLSSPSPGALRPQLNFNGKWDSVLQHHGEFPGQGAPGLCSAERALRVLEKGALVLFRHPILQVRISVLEFLQQTLTPSGLQAGRWTGKPVWGRRACLLHAAVLKKSVHDCHLLSHLVTPGHASESP